MKGAYVLILVSAVLVFGGTGVAVAVSESESDDLPVIVVSMAWQKDMVQEVAGDGYRVVSMLQANTSPHENYSQPTDIAYLYTADIYFMIGSGVEWEEIFLDDVRSNIPDSVDMVSLADSIEYDPLPPVEHHHEHGEHEHHEGEESDPHIWTSPAIVKKMAVAVAQKLKDTYPADSAVFDANLASYEGRIAAVDAEAQALFEYIGGTEYHVMVWHPAWQYFLSQYCASFGMDLDMVAIETSGEVEPSAAIEMIEDEGCDTVYVSVTDEGYENRSVIEEHGISVRVVNPTPADILDSVEDFLRYLKEDLS